MVFVADRVYFECGEGCRWEYDLYKTLEKAYELKHSHKSQYPEKEIDVFEIYRSHVSNYTKRQLTYSKDILNAFKGLLSKMSRNFGIKFLWGLPVNYIQRALMWHSSVAKSKSSAEKDFSAGLEQVGKMKFTMERSSGGWGPAYTKCYLHGLLIPKTRLKMLCLKILY